MKKAGRVYQTLLDVCKKGGIKVKHFEWKGTPCEYDSCVDQLDMKIHIDIELVGTRAGCYILAHEIGHIIDFRKGRYRKFYFAQANSLPDTSKNRTLIAKAEWSANLFAQDLLKEAGLSVKPLKFAQPEYFIERRLPEYFSFYLKPKQHVGIYRRNRTNKPVTRPRKSSRRRNWS